MLQHLKRYCSLACSARNANSVSSLLNSLALRRAYSTLLLYAARIALTSSALHATSTASFPRRTHVAVRAGPTPPAPPPPPRRAALLPSSPGALARRASAAAGDSCKPRRHAGPALARLQALGRSCSGGGGVSSMSKMLYLKKQYCKFKTIINNNLKQYFISRKNI